MPLFKDEESSTYELDEFGRDTYLYYGTGQVKGDISVDQVCITPEFCDPEFTFMVIKQQWGLDRLACSGIVGMSPNHFEEDSDLFIEKMKQTGAIDQSIFSLLIGMNNQQSKITFGGYDLKQFATGPITWHNINPKSTYWQLDMQSFDLRWKEPSKANRQLSMRRDLIVDSGTSFLLLPLHDLKALLDVFEEDSKMQFQIDVIPYAWCTEEQWATFPDMQFTIDGNIYFLPKESYVVKELGICSVMIMNSQYMSEWILGLNFFGNYYTVFD